MPSPSNLDALYHESFGLDVELLHNPTLAELIERVRREHPVEASPPAEVLVSDARVARGALFDLSGRRVEVPAGAAYDLCFVALVDPSPLAAWAHPAWWAFIPSREAAVVLVPTRWPTHPEGPVRLRACVP